MDHGQKPKTTPPAARIGLALETNRLLVLHAPGTKKRVPLFDEQGQRIHGKDNQEAAETALAKVKVATDSGNADTVNRQRWLVAKVCSEYLQYCQRGVANHTISEGHHVNAASWLNDLCAYCGAWPLQN